MNKLSLVLFTSAIAILALPESAKAAPKTKVIWIEEQDTEVTNDKELRRRVVKLEKAVAQLQRRIFELEYKDIDKDASESKTASFTCYIETPFEGLFSVTKASKTEAKAAVAAECSQKTKNSLYCKIEKAVCGE